MRGDSALFLRSGVALANAARAGRAASFVISIVTPSTPFRNFAISRRTSSTSVTVTVHQRSGLPRGQAFWMSAFFFFTASHSLGEMSDRLFSADFYTSQGASPRLQATLTFAFRTRRKRGRPS